MGLFSQQNKNPKQPQVRRKQTKTIKNGQVRTFKLKVMENQRTNFPLNLQWMLVGQNQMTRIINKGHLVDVAILDLNDY